MEKDNPSTIISSCEEVFLNSLNKLDFSNATESIVDEWKPLLDKFTTTSLITLDNAKKQQKPNKLEKYSSLKMPLTDFSLFADLTAAKKPKVDVQQGELKKKKTTTLIGTFIS